MRGELSRSIVGHLGLSSWYRRKYYARILERRKENVAAPERDRNRETPRAGSGLLRRQPPDGPRPRWFFHGRGRPDASFDARLAFSCNLCKNRLIVRGELNHLQRVAILARPLHPMKRAPGQDIKGANMRKIA